MNTRTPSSWLITVRAFSFLGGVMSFVHLHAHTSYSHDGIGSPLQAAQQVTSLGQTAVASTEHGNMLGLVDLEKACLDVGVKPIFGSEIYYQPTFQKDVKSDKKNGVVGHKAGRYHLTVLAKTQTGYTNLCRMTTHANAHQFYYFPVVTHHDLVTYKQGLIILSGCMSSYLSRAILALDDYTAQAYIESMLRDFGRDFYLEVQPFEVPTNDGEMRGKQAYLNDELLRYADRYGVSVVSTADAHYTSRDMYETFKVGHTMRKHIDPIADYSERFLQSESQMRDAWETMMNSDGQAFLDMTQAIADSTNVTIKQDIQMPVITWTQTPDTYYRELCTSRLEALFARKQTAPDKRRAYTVRLEDELKTFAEKSFSSYMLLCYEVAEYCICHDIEMAARGSVCGSLCAYLTRISKIDPLEHGTVFDRFFSRERTTWPDVDFDIQDDRRHEVFAYLERAYPGQTAPIGNVGHWKTRNLINDLAKHYDLGTLAKQTAVSILEVMGYDEVPRSYEDLMAVKELRVIEDNIPNLFKHFVKLHGSMTHMSKHASGLVITAAPIDTVLPLVYQPSTGKLTTAYDKDAVEYAGGLKIDLLGVAALTVVKEAERTAGITFTEDQLLAPGIYQEFTRGNTTGNFQFARNQPRRMCWKAKPTCLGDIAALTALNRPVPLKEGSFDQFVAGRSGNANITALHYAYTKETYGALIYQEQVMQICQGLAGMTRGQTDKVLKMLKKYQLDNPDLKAAFINGCVEHGVKDTDAAKLWENMRRYLFCKAHALSYAYLSVRQMHVKIANPYAWTLALLRHESDTGKQYVYMSDAINNAPSKEKRVYFLPASVNSGVNFEGVRLGGRDYIRLGLSTIDGIGPTVADALYQERLAHGDYTSAQDVLDRLPKRIVNSARIDVLEKSGALCFDDAVYGAAVKSLNHKIAKMPSHEL